MSSGYNSFSTFVKKFLVFISPLTLSHFFLSYSLHFVSKFCRQVPNGDVSGLPSNYVINRLLLECSDSKPCCQKHEGEILKLFCQNCDQLICRDCIVIDHRDHKYNFIKDVFPAEKEKILEGVEKSKEYIRYVEKSIETLKGQEQSLHTNFLEVNQKIDNLIDKQIELLQQKRQSIKEELRKSVFTEKNKIQTQIESFVSSLGSAKTSVEIVEQTLSKGSEIDILSAKDQMIQQLTANSATEKLNLLGEVFYDLKADPPLDEQTVAEMMNIIELHRPRFEQVDRTFRTFRQSLRTRDNLYQKYF